MNEILDRFKKINTWSRHGVRAPHKPLLLLYAISIYVKKQRQWLTFEEVDSKLKELLMEFGPSRKSYHPEYPFWRLQNDGIWELQNADNLKSRQSNTDAKRSELLKYNVTGGFKSEVCEQLRKSNKVVLGIIDFLLNSNFPESMHVDILQAVGLDYGIAKTKIKLNARDHTFRDRILQAYNYRCAVCGYDIKIHNRTIGLEAAHIKWHQAGGPDEEHNGIALCSLHHKLFDYGAFSLEQIDNSLIFHVSKKAHGTKRFDDCLMSFHKQRIEVPRHLEYYPKREYIAWHVEEVFKGYL